MVCGAVSFARSSFFVNLVFPAERCAIVEWFNTGAKTSPATNEPLASLTLLPNILAKKAIAEEMDARRVKAG